MTTEIINDARVAAASGEVTKVAAVRVVGSLHKVFGARPVLQTTFGKRKIEYGEIVLAFACDEEWMQELEMDLEGTDFEGYHEQFEGIAFRALKDVHKGTANMVKRWLGDSPFAAFGASNALDEGGVEEVKETLAQAARVEKAADMEVEFNSVESDIIRAALFEMNENPLTAPYNVSAEDYDPNSPWPYEPDFERHLLSFERITEYLASYAPTSNVRRELEELTSENHKISCEQFVNGGLEAVE